MTKFRNLILVGLPEDEHARIVSRLANCEFDCGATLFSAGQKIVEILFPETCVVSLVIELPEGRDIECAVIGYEGVAGLGGSVASQSSHTLQKIQVGGRAWKMTSADVAKCELDCPRLMSRLHIFHDAFVAQSLQSTACIAVHPVDQRLARWMLEMMDRTGSDILRFTHDGFALMVGATRTTISLTLRGFEQAGLLKTNRGQLTVLDRAGLEIMSCRCYHDIAGVYRQSGIRPGARQPF